MKKIKVCILQYGLARGGTDTFVINLCRAIDKDKFDVTVVNPCTYAHINVREQDLRDTGVRILYTSDLRSGLKSKICHFKLLYQILKREKFDIFQTNIDLFNGPNLFLAWLVGVPIRCCHSHNTMQERALVEGFTLPVILYQKLMRMLCWHFSNRRSGCSQDAMNFLFEGYDWHQNNYPIVINNGIDIKKFRSSIDICKKKREIGLTNKFNIITIGKLTPQKNSVFIAETISLLCKQRADCDFVWVGIGPLEDECKAIFERAGVLQRIHFLGSRNDVNEILPCCDLFYMPSAFEGLGIVIIEAQAAGLPCIVSDVVPHEANCGACEYISLDQPQNIWVEAINDVLDGKISLNVDEHKIQKFSIEHLAKQMEQVFTTQNKI